MGRLILYFCASWLFLGQPSHAQDLPLLLENAVRSPPGPKLRLDTVGPASQVRKLVFSPDGKRLYSAGKDKVVRTWEIVERDGKYRLVAGHKFRWEISRGVRGHIHDMEISKTGLIAFAGFSAWGNEANVCVYDVRTRKLVKKLFADATEASPVANLAFSPSGNRLVAVTNHGELRLWDTSHWRELKLEKPAGIQAEFRPLYFYNDDFLIGNAITSDGNQTVKFWSLQKKIVPSTIKNSLKEIVAIEGISNGGFATAHSNGNAYCFRKGKKKTYLRDASKTPDTWITSMATAGNEMVIIATTDSGNSVGSIEYWDVEKAALLERQTVCADGPVRAVAVNQAGTLAAFSGGKNNEIRLVQLVDSASGKRFTKPFSEPPVANAAGEGAYGSRVACSPTSGSFELAIATQQGSEATTIFLDLAGSKFQIGKRTDGQWRTANADAGPYAVNVSTSDCAIELLKQGQHHAVIKLDKETQGTPLSHCWIADQESGVPFAVAIGTEDQNGIFVYGLSKNPDGTLPLLRYFRDHEGGVSSLATTADRRYLVSTSMDQTTKMWCLEGLIESNAKFSDYAAWGADFVLGDEKTVVVDSALKSGIAYARNLKPGTRIVAIESYGGGSNVTTGTAVGMLDILSSSPLWSGIVVYYISPGEEKVEKVYVTPGWEPVITAFFSRAGQWAAWTPYGYYNSSALGDELFGWQLNPALPTEGEPQFFKSSQWREDFEKPEAIEMLLSEGNIHDALAKSAEQKRSGHSPGDAERNRSQHLAGNDSKQETQPDPVITGTNRPADIASEKTKVHGNDSRMSKPVSRPVHRQIASCSPGIQILSPSSGENVNGVSLEVSVQVDFPSPAKPAEYKIRGFLQGANLGEAKHEIVKLESGTRAICRWSTEMPDGMTRFRVEAAPVSGEHRHVRDQVFFNATCDESDSGPPKLFVVGIAANRYSGDLYLKFPVKDVQAVLSRLPVSAASHYETDNEFIEFFRNQQITKDLFPDQIGYVLENLKEVARPQDLLIVYIAGHGTELDGEYYFVPPSPELDSREKLERDCEKFGVPWEVMAQLADSGCRTIFMLDTCYSGNVLAAEKARTRPLVSRQAVVISSSSAGQLAYEDTEELKHGVFSWCLLEALDMKADADGDDVVDINELIDFLETEVPMQSMKVIQRGSTHAFASARGAAATLTPQRPVSSTHDFDYLPIASPTTK